ncbi:s-adenosyl-methyltransferase [Blastocystis sp. subtype 4]|uniref:s-adenosyl-methyltransferase n=1 Tax=Blastocystis sp. subtype 4 TaxID=944170 RepID=UPI0007119008|nr:s-adenosyl-methyltransferase [Blastocystis sp. subtype 4]KNB44643.1 s-adenosyl-methyltransferase [Blastocystis sp. subtype 4]|eukprot:XP_014528073.1 s-adenosyl-methyltransferase [Blastocystis sp. subtype 4]
MDLPYLLTDEVTPKLFSLPFLLRIYCVLTAILLLDSLSHLCYFQMHDELMYRLQSYGDRVKVVTDSYAEIGKILQSQKANGILLDLGFNSVHVDEAERGFSFLLEGPLDMRYDQSSGITASDLVNGLDAQSLAAIFAEYSGESLRTSRHIGNAIVAHRQSKGPFTTTTELAMFLNHHLGNRKGSKTPCTGLFQALRIAVNDEFKHVDAFMSSLPFVLERGGVFVALCFQSLEVRRLKMWSEWRKQHTLEDQSFTILTSKLIPPSENEVATNNRSRSALLYAIQRRLTVS